MDRDISKVFLTITNRCNNHCSYCFQDKNKGKNDLDIELIERILEELSFMNVKRVILTGGEATLHSQFNLILDKMKNYKFEVQLFSNGLLSDKTIDVINESKISTVYLSLDDVNANSENLRGNIDINIIKNCINKLNKPIIIMNTVNSQNYKNVEEFINFCIKEKKIKKVNFNPIKILHNSYKELELSSEMLHSINDNINKYARYTSMCMRSYYNKNSERMMNCSAGKSSIAIDMNGDISGCIFGSAVSVETFVVGNIFEESLETIWNDEKRWEIFRKCADNVCTDCINFKTQCSGVCCIEKYLVENNRGEYLCEMR